jgi:alpha-ketoglutarate-dependent sulfate ester dioxygenase
MSDLAAHVQTDEGLSIHPIAGVVGAEIRGVKLSGQLPAKAFAAIRAALLEYKVLAFRDQQHLDDAAQQDFARLFGPLVEHPTQPSRPETNVLELDANRGGGRADRWHTDVTFVDAYPAISVLRSVVVPAKGGDTVWTNTAAAYAGLNPALRSLADQLWAVHSNLYDYASHRPAATAADREKYEKVFTSRVFETEHPLVHVHPETGERSLILGSFVRRLVGLSQEESDLLYRLFQTHATRLEYTFRWRWQAGDVLIWDNRATQHIAINDYGDEPRVVRRVTVDGVAPVSIDGRRSRTLREAAKSDAAH